jgi:hypothetical protein
MKSEMTFVSSHVDDMLHGVGGTIAGEQKVSNVLELVELLARAPGRRWLRRAELIGHGAPGRLVLGWHEDDDAMLDVSDATYARLMNVRDVFDPEGDGICLLGCTVAERYPREPWRDGRVLGYALSRMLGVRVSVSTTALFPSDFDAGGLSPAARERLLIVDARKKDPFEEPEAERALAKRIALPEEPTAADEPFEKVQTEAAPINTKLASNLGLDPVKTKTLLHWFDEKRVYDAKGLLALPDRTFTLDEGGPRSWGGALVCGGSGLLISRPEKSDLLYLLGDDHPRSRDSLLEWLG